MKIAQLSRYVTIPFLLLIFISCKAQNPENWTAKQLMEPADLAVSLQNQKDVPVILCVGPGASIPNSVHVGMVNNKEGLDKLKKQLTGVDKKSKIVLYCGCCPFEHCPNVRPAITVLNDLKFTNYYLLNIPHNIKKDWIDKGFPVNK